MHTRLQLNNDWHDALLGLNEAMDLKPSMTIAAVSKMLDSVTVSTKSIDSLITVKTYAEYIKLLRRSFDVFSAKQPVNELNSYLKLLDRHNELDMSEFRSLLVRAIEINKNSREKHEKRAANQEEVVNLYVQQLHEWRSNPQEITKIVSKIKNDKRVRINEIKKIYHGMTGYIDKKKTKKAYFDAIEARAFELKLQSERIDTLK